MSYWLAPSLERLRDELNRGAPNRDKTSDGWIGDKKHANSKSDHNPMKWPRAWAGVVRAYDIDADLNNGTSSEQLAAKLISMLGKHPALGSGAYIIHNGKITSTDRLSEGSRVYTGANAHESHIHVSVARLAAGYNSLQSWGIFKEDEVMNAAQEKKLDRTAKDAKAAREYARRSVERGKVNTRFMMRLADKLELDISDLAEAIKELDDSIEALDKE